MDSLSNELEFSKNSNGVQPSKEDGNSNLNQGSNVPGQNQSVPDPNSVKKDEGSETKGKDLAKHFQALFNKTENELKKIKPKAEFFDLILKDQKARRAVLAKLEPDLFKPVKPESYVEEKLKEEFGENFREEFEENQINIPGTKSWSINLRAMELYKEAKEQTKAPPKLEEYLEELKNKTKEQKEKFNSKKQEIMQKYNIDENTFHRFVDWQSKLQMEDLVYMFLTSSKQLTNQEAPNLSTVPGHSPQQSDPFEKMINEAFGPPERSFDSVLFNQK